MSPYVRTTCIVFVAALLAAPAGAQEELPWPGDRVRVVAPGARLEIRGSERSLLPDPHPTLVGRLVGAFPDTLLIAPEEKSVLQAIPAVNVLRIQRRRPASRLRGLGIGAGVGAAVGSMVGLIAEAGREGECGRGRGGLSRALPPGQLLAPAIGGRRRFRLAPCLHESYRRHEPETRMPGRARKEPAVNRPLALRSLMIAAACGCTPGGGPSSPDEGSASIRFLPREPQVLVVGERRSLWVTAPSDFELTVKSGGAISELGREQPFGPGMTRLDVEGVAPGTATVRARVRNGGAAAEATFQVLARGEPWCETEGPPPYCVVGRYRIEATELSDQCTGVRDSFETTMEIARSATHADSATVHFEDRLIGQGQIGPDGVFFTVLPQRIGSFRDGREVILEPIAVKVAGFRVTGRLDVIGLFPSPDPIDEAPCERSWELEGERIGGSRLSTIPRGVRRVSTSIYRSEIFGVDSYPESVDRLWPI